MNIISPARLLIPAARFPISEGRGGPRSAIGPGKKAGEGMDIEQFEIDLNAKCVCGCMDGGRFHKIYRFDNDYGASVVGNPRIEGFDSDGYQVMFLRFEGDEYSVEEVPGMGPKVVSVESWTKALHLLKELSELDEQT